VYFFRRKRDLITFPGTQANDRQNSEEKGRAEHTNSLINAQDQTTRLDGSLDGVDFDEGGLPDESVEVVADALVVEVDAGPDVALAVLDAQPVEDVGGVEAGVVAQLARDDLERFGEGLDDGLLLVADGGVGVGV